MTKSKRLVYTRDFKIDAARRMAAGESPKLLSQELGVPRQQLYAWHTVLRERGDEAWRAWAGEPASDGKHAMNP